jgi:hypothetical protein
MRKKDFRGLLFDSPRILLRFSKDIYPCLFGEWLVCDWLSGSEGNGGNSRLGMTFHWLTIIIAKKTFFKDSELLLDGHLWWRSLLHRPSLGECRVASHEHDQTSIFWQTRAQWSASDRSRTPSNPTISQLRAIDNADHLIVG